MESIKKLWRYVLHIVIEYITLDTRFDRVRTHHFVLLNHFRHGIKISFLYYLLTSMSKAISSFKKKTSVNPALHEGLLLLIHKYFKAQTISNNPSHDADAIEDTDNTSFSSDSNDIQIIILEGEENTSLGKKVKGKETKLPSSITPSRKSPRGHGPKNLGQDEKEYNEEGKDMVFDEEVKEKKEKKQKYLAGEKWKRESGTNDERVSSQGSKVSTIPLSLVHPQSQPQEQDKESIGGEGGEVVVKERQKSSKNFNVRMTKMGIVREIMNPQILVGNQGQPQFEDLINPTIVAITDNARETGMNLLDNAHNNMIDNFISIKWLYHELEEFSEKIGQMESNKKDADQDNQKDQEDRFNLAKRRIQNMENYNHNLVNQMISLLNSINDNILSLTGVLKARGLLDEDDEKDKGRARTDEDMATDITFTSMDQEVQKTHEKMTEETHKAYEAIQTMQELERKIEEQFSCSFFLLFRCLLFFAGFILSWLSDWMFFWPFRWPSFLGGIFSYYQPCELSFLARL